MTRHAVYRCIDAQGAVIYAGLSNNPRRRVYEHKCRADWAPQIDRVDVEWFDSREAAMAAERKAIMDDQPPQNRALPSGSRPVSNHAVARILALWPGRADILEDARAASADLDLYAVHRWCQRGAVPSGYWRALLDGAARRGIPLTADDFVDAHAIAADDQADRSAA
jgi:hypothetical protein